MDKSIENTNSIKQPEEWKPIPGYEGMYEVSSYGRVRSYKWQKERILVPRWDRYGYYRVNLCKDGKIKTYQIHRLVAEAFISNPSNFPQVNHKDENKRNNCVQNLEWSTQAYNLAYGTRVKRMTEKLSKAVVQLDKNGIFIAEYSSMQEAFRVTGIFQGNICNCCNHKYGHKSAKGYIFIFKDEYLNTQTHQDK